MPKTFLRSILTSLALVTVLAGCTRLSVSSTPEGARLLWSPTGTGDWRPWPPRVWADPQQAGAVQPEMAEYYTTPYSTRGRYGDTVWITVEKEGYYRPLPQTAQLYLFRNERLEFDLVETPQSFAERMTEQGLIRYQGEWVDPAEQGLVLAADGLWVTPEEAFALEQQAKGLVEFEGQWVQAEERERLFAESQRAAGLVLYNDRWVTPEVREAAESVERRVAEILETAEEQLEQPKVIGRVETYEAQLQIINSTSQTARFLISGTRPREVMLERYANSDRILLEPGRYTIAVLPEPPMEVAPGQAGEYQIPALIEREQDFQPTYINTPFASGFKYVLTYNGGLGASVGSFSDYQIPQPQLPFDVPEIEIPDVQIPEDEAPQRGRRPGGPPRE